MRYFEFGAGLGDVLNDIYRYNGYAALQGAPRSEKCRVSIISHNPAVRELFQHWPGGADMQITEYGYWTPEQDAEMRRKHRLPKPVREPLPDWAKFDFYNHPGDEAVLAELPDEYVVFSVSAGEPERTVPFRIASEIRAEVNHDLYIPVVSVGRNYKRNGRPMEARFGLRLMDVISLPATLNVVRDPRCKGVVCAHSSISMLAGWENKPQLLLYDEATRQRHFQAKDQWSWYAYERGNVFHATFDQWQSAAEQFFNHIQ
jgi:hypothetical protein